MNKVMVMVLLGYNVAECNERFHFQGFMMLVNS